MTVTLGDGQLFGRFAMPSKKSGSRGQLRARMETCSADVDKFVAHIGKLVDHERESCKITAAFVADLEQMVGSEPFVGLANAMQCIVDGLGELARVREQVMCVRLDQIVRDAAPSKAAKGKSAPPPETAPPEATSAPDATATAASAPQCGLRTYVKEQCIDPVVELLKHRDDGAGGDEKEDEEGAPQKGDKALSVPLPGPPIDPAAGGAFPPPKPSEDGSNEKPSALQGRSTRSRFDQEVELCEIYRVRAMKRAFEELVRGQVWCYCRALEALAPAVHALGEVDLEMARECLREDMARWAA